MLLMLELGFCWDICCRLLGANADILQLSNSLSGPARLHLVSGDELRVITRSDEPLENLLGVCYQLVSFATMSHTVYVNVC